MQNFLNRKMVAKGICREKERPVKRTLVVPDRKYQFAEVDTHCYTCTSHNAVLFYACVYAIIRVFCTFGIMKRVTCASGKTVANANVLSPDIGV